MDAYNNESCVEVALRIRPLIDSEIQRGCKDILEVLDELQQVRIRNSDKAFTYNYVFGPQAPQQLVYSKSVEKKVGELFKGYNVTILAYGQTGSGKTHSMGTAYDGTGEMGIIPRCVHDIFNTCKDHFSYDFNVTVSFMELYQETLYDLLAERPREQCVMDIREDGNRGVVIPGLTEIETKTAAEALRFLAKGSLGRATSSTNMNSQSSRSHAIFTINICMQHKQQSNLNKTAKFHLVDLAGSERPKKTGATGQTFREGVNINKGLLVLGNVISALGDEKQQHGHIPYRDSNLTRLLKDSLGGNSITLMIACCSPADYNVDETVSTLRYADRARKIKNKPVVNQDPKAAEINRLNKLVHQLRLELIGQGGPMVCQAELDLLKSQNESLKTKTVDLTAKLSSTLNENTALLEKLLIVQTVNEKLTEKIQEFKEKYDITLNNINESLQKDDVDGVKDQVTKLHEIQKEFIVLEKEQKESEQELRFGEVNNFTTARNVTFDIVTEREINEKQELHTAQQVALNAELQDLMHQLAVKEHLARQIAANTNFMVDYNAIAEHEAKIAILEREKEDLLQQLRNVSVAPSNTKVAELRKKQIQELETRISDLKKKVQEQGKLIKLKEKDEQKIKQLNNEILQMKQTRVKLIRAMKQESEKFRSWKMQREREMHKLKEQDRKRQNQMAKMETMHNRQQNVLKRKVEEVAALNKRLKDALAVRKSAQENRAAGKTGKVGNWVQQEFEVYINIVDAQATLQSLMEDRANLHEQLTHLKENPMLAETTEINQLEEEIEVRSVQISDLQQKILDFDEENRSKTRWDSIQSMTDAKHALKTLFNLIGEKKIGSSNHVLEMQSENVELKARLHELDAALKEQENKFTEELARQARDSEEKVKLLIHQLRGMECNGGDEDLKERCRIQQEVIEKLEAEMQELQKSNRLSLIDEDDKEKDPDWRKTPLGKRIRKMLPHPSTFNNADEMKPVKRTSEGGCTCRRNCSTRTCGCKKNGRSCGAGCKCLGEICANRGENVSSSTENSVASDASETIAQENLLDLLPPPVDYPKRKKRNLFS